MELVFDIKLSKSQQQMYDLIHNDKYKYYTFVASRQSGKSVLMQILCIEWLMQNNNRIAYVCRNFILAKKLYRDLVKIIPKEVIKTANGSDLFIESTYGSNLIFVSAEQGSSLRGNTYTHLICDEFSFHKQEQTDGTHLFYDILSPTLKARGKKFIAITTPLGKNNIAYDFYLRGQSEEYPEYISLIKTVYDDGFISNEQIEEIKKSVPKATFDREYLCIFEDNGISFFQGYAECFDIDEQKGGKSYIGIDLSGDGQDATILSSINDNGEVKQYEITGTLDMKYQKIADIINKINPVSTYVEINGLGKPIYNEIRKLVKNSHTLNEWLTTNSTKEEIISDLAVTIANKNIHFERNDNKLFNELSNFVATTTKSGKMTYGGKNSHDDRIMSLAIALRCRKDNMVKSGKNYISVVRI